MITLDLKVNNKLNKVKIKDEVLFNALLSKNTSLIKKLIKIEAPFYKISDAFFDIVNTYVDFTKDGISLYGGLIVRTNICRYAVLYLKESIIDEEYMIKLIDDYIHDIGDYMPKKIDIDKFSINKHTFLKTLKNTEE